MSHDRSLYGGVIQQLLAQRVAQCVVDLHGSRSNFPDAPVVAITIPLLQTERYCISCGEPVEEIRLDNGVSYLASVFPEGCLRRINLTDPHACVPMRQRITEEFTEACELWGNAR